MAGRHQPYGETRDVIAPYGDDRLRPPASLGPAERAAFVDLVGSRHEQAFRGRPICRLVCRWCEASRVGREGGGDGAGDRGVRVIDEQARIRWCAVYQMAVKSLTMLGA